jgi:hypothetical protein
MFDLYRICAAPPSSFAQTFERVARKVNQRGLTLLTAGVSGINLNLATRSNKCLNVPAELLYRQAYGTE